MKPPLRLALLPLACAAAAAQAQVSLTAKPLGRDQAIAFYTARGFPAEAIAAYAGACVLSLRFANNGKSALSFHLADWTAGNGVGFRPPEGWEAEWEQRGLPAAARIAFRWAQFPPEQEFAAGDWIMGMAVPQQRISGAFRVTARYFDDKGRHELASNAVSCRD